MRSRSLNLLRSLGKFGVVGAGIAASTFATVVIAKAATSPSETCADAPQRTQYHMPESDHPPFRKWNFNWDRMEPGQETCIWPVPKNEKGDPSDKKNLVPVSKDSNDSSADAYPKARRNLFFIRHGQYINVGDDDNGHILTPLGEEQAAITGKKLGSMGIKFSSIISSAMTRAKQTAGIILENMDSENQRDLKLEVNDPLLSEGTPCIPEPPFRNVDMWNPSEREILVEGARIEAGFRKYFHRADPSQENDSWEIIVCHGNVIRYCSCRALQFPPEGWLRISVDHCSITRFTILPTGEVILRGLGDSGHIPYEKATVM